MNSQEINLPKEINGNVTCIDLHEADFAFLQKQITAAEGKIITIVHPFAGVREQSEEIPNKQYTMNINRFIKASLASKPPVILFEEAEKLEELSTKLKSLEKQNAMVYVIKTIPANSEPVTGSLVDIAKKLKNVGATRTLLAGSLLGYNQPNKTIAGVSINPMFSLRWDSEELDGCVGGVATAFMQQGIDACFSRATYPRTLQYYVR